jgi:NADPH2:quinone reductase
MRVARIEEFGGPETLKIVDIPIKPLEAGEVRIRHKALGLNYIDIYYRTGIYQPTLPAVLGFEACGIVEEVGEDNGGFKVGDRVAYATAPLGAYCEMRNVHHDYIVHVPKEVTDKQAAAVLFKGMTAHYLLRRTFFVKPEMIILIHAAAGGMGHFLVQMAKFYKAIVIGTVSSEEKAKIAKDLGCDYVINYKTEDIAKRVNEITHGAGVHVVYDAVGKDTFLASLDSLGLFGLMVSYGQASGDVPPFDIRRLTEKSLFITRPTLFLYKNHRKELKMSANEVFQMLINKAISDNINQIYKFDDIVKAHQDLESRKTIGSSVIVF